MTNPESQSTGKSVILLHFTYGISNDWKLTNANTDLDTKLGKFLHDPKIKVKLPTNSISGFGKSEAIVDISLDPWLFAQEITSGRAFPPLNLTIYERFTDVIRKKFTGIVKSAARHAKGKEGIVQIKVAAPKNDLDQAAGFSCNDTCNWRFGNPKTCQKDLVPLTETGTLVFQAAVSTKVTITGLSTHPNRYWRRGKVTYNGLTIKIRSWLNGTDFYLSKVPPDSWNGAPVSVIPGCDKKENTCTFWGQAHRFSGIAKEALEHNPIFENPTQ